MGKPEEPKECEEGVLFAELRGLTVCRIISPVAEKAEMAVESHAMAKRIDSAATPHMAQHAM